MLDDFTLGFQIRYADMAGGCEEVVAVAGGIRTRTGTSVELDKKTRRRGWLKILVGQMGLLKEKYWRAGPLPNNFWRNSD
jgi:hypothetical protein